MAGAYGEDDYQPQTYQDDLSTDDSASDPAMDDLTENVAEEIGIPEEELGNELNKYTGSDQPASESSDIDQDELEDRGSLIEDEDDEGGTLPANER